MKLHSIRRRIAVLAALLAVFIVFPMAPSASADPDEEGSVGGDLDQAIDDYLEAENALKAAEDEQEDLKDEIKDSKEKVKQLKADVADFAEAAYLNGGIPDATSVLTSGNPDRAVAEMTVVTYLGNQSAKTLQDLIDSKADLGAQEEALEAEIDEAAEAAEKQEGARDDAARALAASGGEDVSGPSPGDFRTADPAPRNPDGSLPGEGCSVDDPTTDGCISPRTDHALSQAIIAGFKRYTACYRPTEDNGEHPRGKACDFSVTPGGFEGYAEGDAKTYGDNLAAWFVENADALGVKYVIWFNQIWEPGNGWGPYPGCGGSSPSCDHTNHVHLSMQ
ncbi:MAG: coiled-coil domain-containing protein [Stackebrandtia sp.]